MGKKHKDNQEQFTTMILKEWQAIYYTDRIELFKDDMHLYPEKVFSRNTTLETILTWISGHETGSMSGVVTGHAMGYAQCMESLGEHNAHV